MSSPPGQGEGRGARDLVRAVAWDRELTRVHELLRGALVIARASIEDSDGETHLDLDLQTFCVGFCAALDGHHRGEDVSLFPALLNEHPELADVVTSLKRDHDMLSHLLGELQRALSAGADRAELDRHLDGIDAVMETLFRYEERMLLAPLRELHLAASSAQVLGPLA